MTKEEQELREAITRLDKKEFGLYFYTVDSHGNALAAIANIYEHVKTLNGLGYNAVVLHDKTEYVGVADWMGQEYADLPHMSLESQQLRIGGSDFIIIPEVFAKMMDQVKNLPAKKIVMVQAYDYILELIDVGITWAHFGVKDAICTTEKGSQYVKSLFPSTNTEIIPVAIPEFFKGSDKPRIPEVAIMARDQQVAAKIIKSFYLQYPMYKWVGIPEVRGLSREQAAERIGKSCLAVWVDDISGFGTFPLECMEAGTPVIGKIPNLVPEWMEKTNEDGSKVIINNGVWTSDLLNIPELIAKYLQAWLEDNEPQEIIDEMKASTGQYTSEKRDTAIETVYAKFVNNRKEELGEIADQFAEAEAKEVEKQATLQNEEK